MLEIPHAHIQSVEKQNKSFLTMQKKDAIEEHVMTAAEFKEDGKKNEEKISQFD